MRSPEFFFEFAVVHFDEGRAAVRAGIGHGAMAEVSEELLEFGTGEGIVGFDGVAADSFRDDVFAHAPGVDFLAGGFEGVDQFEDEFFLIRGFNERRQGIEEEGAFAEFAEPDAEAGESFELLPEEIGVFG